MQIMFGTILCILLKGLILTKATITPKDYITSNSLREENVYMYPDLNFTQDISMSEKSDHHILNFKSERSYSDSMTVRKEREFEVEVAFANISITPESIESKPTSLRAFVQSDSQFTEKVNDIFVTLRWNQPEFTDEIIQGYTVQCFFIEDLKEIQICDDKNITTIKLEHTVHNLTSNTTYYFRVRAHTKIVAGPYTDLINVSTTHENPIPKFLLRTDLDMKILDVDLRINNTLISGSVTYVAYSIQEHRIYWLTERDLMTLKINENNITKIASFDNYAYSLSIDWVARNLYIAYIKDYSYIIKFDLTMWENGIIKFDEIYKSKNDILRLSVSPSMGILYIHESYKLINKKYRMRKFHRMMKYHLDGKVEQIVQINKCLFDYIIDYIPDPFHNMIIDNMNNEVPLIYWLSNDYTFVTDINISMCNTILYKENISDITSSFKSMTIDKKNIYILTSDYWDEFSLYVLKKKYASLKSVNAAEYVEKIIISSHKLVREIHAFDKSLQPYPPMRCLTPDEKVYNFENVNATPNSIIVNLPEPVVKNGCKKYNLPTTIYTISVSCLDNNLNKSEKFNVLRYVTFERYYEIQNLTSCTEYQLKFTLSNFYFDQLSINPFDSNVIPIKTNSDIASTPGIIAKEYYLLFMLSFIVIVTIICICYINYLYRQRKDNNEQFLTSTTADVELAILHEVPCRNTQVNMIYSRVSIFHYNPDEYAITKIARNQITFTKHLGSGAFGMVYQGKVKDLEKSGIEMSVAIKTLRKDATPREKEKFLKEAKLMNHFQHKHILRLLAVCLDGDSPLLVLELMETGDLLKYLRECRNLQASDSLALRLQDLLAICEDVARGCCYLEELRFVHRDLACRNCLVSSRNRENRVIKIGDFGLARDIYKDDYYRVKGEDLFPIRWMAPESLIMGIFTSQSDVWSFGILMWEITSLGEQPYSAKTNEEVINYVRDGGRLPMTLNCPSPLYQLMLRCWSAADARPNFKFCLENITALRKNMEDALLSPVDTI
ncbi:proto-oncogene tyrosine-protein kinase ROS-like [Camponotus floridanus]|uniref:proto-oncogene tyrosine-protein kinase ROS-like n=1 Tax=Camponotus floridanus TaxID=104421 RepID=UPI000DC69ED0|nr:proto-oncogene tyrosine-protein kinase ROS-like [Camponotus floridanus]